MDCHIGNRWDTKDVTERWKLNSITLSKEKGKFEDIKGINI